MTVRDLQGWFEDTVQVPGGLKSSDELIAHRDCLSVVRDGDFIACIDFPTNMLTWLEKGHTNA